jgi:hypothetical protein
MRRQASQQNENKEVPQGGSRLRIRKDVARAFRIRRHARNQPTQQVVEMDTFCNRPCENLARITVRAVVYAPRGNDVRKSEDERSQAMRALSRNRMHWRERFNSFEAHWANARRCRTCGGASGATPMSSCFFGREPYA